FVHHFETGTVLAEKVRQDHVLDAAAYSGALVQARSLNMLAYIHRAQAAHQVAMAHLVTLGSLRSEEHTSELQSRENLVCRLLLLAPPGTTLFPYATLFRSRLSTISRRARCWPRRCGRTTCWMRLLTVVRWFRRVR